MHLNAVETTDGGVEAQTVLWPLQMFTTSEAFLI